MRECDFGVVFPINLCKPLIRRSALPHGAMGRGGFLSGLSSSRSPESSKLGTPGGITGALRFPVLPFFSLVTPADNLVWELRMRPSGTARWRRDTLHLKQRWRPLVTEYRDNKWLFSWYRSQIRRGRPPQSSRRFSRVPTCAGYRPARRVDLPARSRSAISEGGSRPSNTNVLP